MSINWIAGRFTLRLPPVFYKGLHTAEALAAGSPCLRPLIRYTGPESPRWPEDHSSAPPNKRRRFEDISILFLSDLSEGIGAFFQLGLTIVMPAGEAARAFFCFCGCAISTPSFLN